jgi:hypothetical protein
LKDEQGHPVFNCQITQLPNKTRNFAQVSISGFKEQRAANNEGSGISKKDLRQVQDRAPQGRGACDLRKLET